MDVNRIKSNYEGFKYFEQLALTRIENKEYPDSINLFLLQLAGECSSLGLYHLLNDEMNKTKVYFSKAAICYEYAVLKTGQHIDYAHFYFAYAIVSDNETVIQRLLSIEQDFYLNDNFIGYTHRKVLQAFLKEDKADLAFRIANLEKSLMSGQWSKYKGWIDSFSGLMNKDKTQIEKGIKELVGEHDIDSPASIGEFVCLHGLAIAKMAWRIGIEVEINNPLIPKGLLPYEALPIYEGYDFFKEIGY